MRELAPWVKRVGPWLFVGVSLLSSWFVLAVTPPHQFFTVEFALSAASFAIIARLSVPLRQRIRGRRKERPAAIGIGSVAAAFLIAGILARIRPDLFLPVAAGGFVGFFTAVGGLIAYEVLWKSKLMFCVHCGTHKAFLRDRGDWFCSNCGHGADSDGHVG